MLDNKAEAWERFGEAALVQVRRPMYQPVCVLHGLMAAGCVRVVVDLSVRAIDARR